MLEAGPEAGTGRCWPLAPCQELPGVDWPLSCAARWSGWVCQVLYCTVGLSGLEAVLVFSLGLACGPVCGGCLGHDFRMARVAAAPTYMPSEVTCLLGDSLG